MMAFFWMLERDFTRFSDLFKRMGRCPLGSAALAGTDFPIDRDFTAEHLGFDGPTENSIDAVSDRDHMVEFNAAAAMCYMHLSRLSEELVTFSTQDFKFIELSDDFCTGSSIMPQKKNPDIAEKIRGKTGRMYGNLMAILTIMKGIPLAYNTDLSEDKEQVFDSIDTLLQSLAIMTPMIEKMRVNGERPAPTPISATPTPRTSPTISPRRACRFAKRTTSWAPWSTTASSTASVSTTSRWKSTSSSPTRSKRTSVTKSASRRAFAPARATAARRPTWSPCSSSAPTRCLKPKAASSGSDPL